MFSYLQKFKTYQAKYLKYPNFQHPCSLCTWCRSSRLLCSRPHRCPPSDFGPVRLAAFFRAAYYVPPSSLPAARASGHSGSTTRTLLRNPQDSRAVLRTTAVFAPRTINHSRNCQAQVISPSFGL